MVETLEEVFELVSMDGGSWVRMHPIEHLTKIRCREVTVKDLQSSTAITDKYDLNIKRLNRWWYLVVFVDKTHLKEGFFD